MTYQDSQVTPNARNNFKLPGLAIALFIISPVLLLLGTVVFYGTTSRLYFDTTPTQDNLSSIILAIVSGTAIILGVAMFVGALILTGIRSLLNQDKSK